MESGGEIVPVHNSVDTVDAASAAVIDTVNAAAAAILTAGSRRQPDVLPRRKWADQLSMYFCFGSQKNGRRINYAALVPEPTPPRTDAPAGEIPNHTPPPVFPFVAPPSSPASLLQSEPSSIAQSPSNDAQPFSLNSPSLTSPPSIFATGPYANETEVVSPPVFSAFTTESSTAAFTPPESVHLTTPSSPEVPYAKLLTSVDNSQNGETVDLQSYPNWPDSPIVHLISPCSGYSGTSSPFPDPETPKLFDGEGTGTQKLIPRNMRNGYFLLDGHITAAVPVADFSARLQHNDHDMDHQVSFDLTVADVARRLEKKTAILGDSATTSFRFAPSSGDHKRDLYHDLPEKVRQSLSLRMPREFNINVIDAPNVEPTVGNEKVAGITVELEKTRSYPVAQQGVS